jgi:hypothetical protein
MPTKRETIDRARRNRLTDEEVALFRRLDAVPVPERDEGWQKESRRLAALLGPMDIVGIRGQPSSEDFESAWFCGQIDVLDPRLDRDRPGYWGGAPLARVREMREQLLAATKLH